ncbi:MAG: hypothetical protein ACI8T1_001361 [Verrucomicrobiales bacterium]|jgi:hypothetical protein
MLSDKQKDMVRSWAEAGEGLGEIHKRITGELQVPMTYFDARLLVSELQISLDKPEPVEDPDANDASIEEDIEEDIEEESISDGELEGDGAVNLTVDAIAQPQSLVSGKVTFSDGKRASWSLDQMGRLGIDPEEEGYRPSQEDAMAFQQQLQKTLESQGF